MKWLILISIFLCMNDEIVIFDKAQSLQKWYITNDVVMGGLSKSTMKVDKGGKAIFSGEVSIENNGGFAMTRLPLNLKLDSKKSKIVLQLKGLNSSLALACVGAELSNDWDAYLSLKCILLVAGIWRHHCGIERSINVLTVL